MAYCGYVTLLQTKQNGARFPAPFGYLECTAGRGLTIIMNISPKKYATRPRKNCQLPPDMAPSVTDARATIGKHIPVVHFPGLTVSSYTASIPIAKHATLHTKKLISSTVMFILLIMIQGIYNMGCKNLLFFFKLGIGRTTGFWRLVAGAWSPARVRSASWRRWCL